MGLARSELPRRDNDLGTGEWPDRGLRCLVRFSLCGQQIEQAHEKNVQLQCQVLERQSRQTQRWQLYICKRKFRETAQAKVKTQSTLYSPRFELVAIAGDQAAFALIERLLAVLKARREAV